MKLTHIRHKRIGDTCIHDLYADGKLIMSGIENDNKLIKPGTYKLALRNDMTPLTRRYLNSSAVGDWFSRFIEVQDVPGRSMLYFHSANLAEQLDGCIAHGMVNHSTGFCAHSITHMRKFYEICLPLLSEIEYTITDVKDTMDYYIRH